MTDSMAAGKWWRGKAVIEYGGEISDEGHAF